MIRDPAQKSTITALGANKSGQLDVLLSSIEEVQSQAQAQAIVESSSPNYIVFSAGAGGKGGPERTQAIDRDAAIAFIRAAVATTTVTKFILISYVGSRRSKAPWWSNAEWQATQDVNNGALKNYYTAKLAADEALKALSKQRGSGFAGLSLRPGSLTDEDGEGKVILGKTMARGKVRRGDVARVVMALLDSQEIDSCWLDLLEGSEDVDSAVKGCVQEKVDCSEGDDMEASLRT